MMLGEVIAILESLDPDRVLKNGFHFAHSYRGYYDQVAFVPIEGITVRAVLMACWDALTGTFTGWKGGEYAYSICTPVNIAYEGQTGHPLTQDVFHCMISIDPDKPSAVEVAIQEIADRFERCASTLVGAEYALGYREAIQHITEALLKKEII
jgi:hypothetical protein